jgi:hypothetical protein
LNLVHSMNIYDHGKWSSWLKRYKCEMLKLILSLVTPAGTTVLKIIMWNTKLMDLHLLYHNIQISSKSSLVHVIETVWMEKYYKHKACEYKIVLSSVQVCMNRDHWIFLWYSQILLLWHWRNQTGAGLSAITYAITGIFYYCSYTWASQLIRGVFHMDLLFIWWVRVRGFFFVLWRVFIPVEFDGLAVKELGDTTVVYV